MFGVLQDANLYCHIDDRPPASIDALRRRYRSLARSRSKDGSETWLNWIIFLKHSNETIDYYQATVKTDHALIAYVINSQFWQRGFAEEAGKSVLRHLFDASAIGEIRAEINESNDASIKLASRLGFSFKKRNENEIVFSLPRKRYKPDISH